MLRLINKLLNPVKRQIRQLITRGLVKMVDPTQMIQLLQVELLSGEVLDRVEHFEPYGFTSNPPTDGAEVLAASLNGRRSHTVAFMVANRLFRMKNNSPGEVALFTDEGDVIHFKRNNEILIDTMGTLVANAGTSATITAPTITANGDTTINGTLNVTGDATINGIPFSGHKHQEYDAAGLTGVAQ